MNSGGPGESSRGGDESWPGGRAADRPSDRGGRGWLAASSLAWREVVRFFRQRHRVIGAIGQPILFWLLFGAGLQGTFRLGADDSGPSFLEYFFPGTLVLILLFTAIFATISIIEDRREGFLQSVLVAPIPRWSMVLGKVFGGTIIAWLQGMFFLLLAIWLSVEISPARWLAIAAFLFVAGVGLTSFGFVLAWRMDSTQGFHAIMNLLLMPMWLLSGAFFPVPPARPGAATSQLVLHWCMRLNPVTYCVSGIRTLLTGASSHPAMWTPRISVSWGVTIVFAVVMFAAACRIARERTTGDLL